MGELEIRAVTKYVRISPQKVRKMVSAIKGKPVETALNLLAFMPQKSAGIVKKTLKSAAANAEQNTNIDIDNLIVRNLIVDQGPTLRRYRFRARGRVSRILKRTSHITVVLTEASA